MARSPWLIVSGDFARNAGQDRANLALAEHLARRGEETHVACFRAAPELAAMANVHVHRVPKPFGRYALGVPILGAAGVALALRLGAGARVVVNGGNCPASGAINWVHYVHAADRATGRPGLRRGKNAITRTTERVALHGARLVLANSEQTRRDLVQHVGVDDAKIRVVYLGVDGDDFRPLAPAERAATRIALGWDARPRAVFVGAMGDDRKGFDVLYAAWQRLCRDSTWDGCLVVCGAGKMLGAWKDRVRADGLADRVAFLGFRKDIARVVAASDFLIAVPRYEPFGLVVTEALACGVPAITTAISGASEVYPDVLRPWVLPDPEDDVDLASRIRHLRGGLGAPGPARDALVALSAQIRARTWDVVARDVVAACERAP